MNLNQKQNVKLLKRVEELPDVKKFLELISNTVSLTVLPPGTPAPDVPTSKFDPLVEKKIKENQNMRQLIDEITSAMTAGDLEGAKNLANSVLNARPPAPTPKPVEANVEVTTTA